MNPLESQDKLYEWSQANDMESLIKIVLLNDKIVLNDTTVKKTCQVINSFLKEKQEQFAYYNLPSLERLKSLIIQSPISKENIGDLVTTIESSLTSAQENSKFFTDSPNIPVAALSIVDEYCSFRDCINLILLGRKISPEILSNAGSKMSLQEVKEFFDEMQNEKNQDISKKVFEIFNSFASPIAKMSYWAHEQELYRRKNPINLKQFEENQRTKRAKLEGCQLM